MCDHWDVKWLLAHKNVFIVDENFNEVLPDEEEFELNEITNLS